MSLSAYRWGWFGAALSRAIWGWSGIDAPAGGFTPRAAVSAAIFKVAPAVESRLSVRDGRRSMATHRATSAALMHSVKKTASGVGLQGAEATVSKGGSGRAKGAGAGARVVKTGQWPESGGAAKVVNKNQKP